MSKKQKSTSPTAIQVKNLRKTIGTEEKQDVTSQFGKSERIVDISLNVRFTHISVHIIHDADRGSTEVKALCYKSKGNWFDSRWCHWNFSLA